MSKPLLISDLLQMLPTLARRRGDEFGEVADQIPEDVAVAARTAEHLRVVLSVSGDVTAESWPPMQMRISP